MKQLVHFGNGKIGQIPAVLDQLGANSIFLVTGRESYRRSGAQALLQDSLAGRRLAHFDDFSPNPQLPDVEKGIARYRQAKCETILAVGGGTVLDMGKLIGIGANPGATPLEVVTGQIPIQWEAPPIVAVPTTAGSGSEATHFAVVYVNGVKYSVADPSILPAHAVVDPQLTASLPPSVTGVTGLDAFCQAVESLWSVNSTEESRAFSREAIALAWRGLDDAVHRPTPSSRLQMCRASHLAGKAINITKTTAPHAISYTLTSHFGVPHGHAVALTLGPMLVYNAGVPDDDVSDARGASHVRLIIQELNHLLGCSTPNESCSRITELIGGIGLATRLDEVGVKTQEDRQLLVDGVNMQRLKNNPRLLTEAALRQILSQIS